MKAHRFYTSLTLVLTCFILVGNFFPTLGIGTANANPEGRVPIKWAVIVMGGYNYYRDLTYNSIQRIEKIMQGRGVPYDLFQDDAIAAPTDSPPPGRYALQHADGTLRYQVLVLLFDYEPSDQTGANQTYIYWAIGNGTNAVLFNKVAAAVPVLLRMAPNEVGWDWRLATTSHTVGRTFNDGIKEYRQGSTITLGATLQFHAIIHTAAQMTVWFNKTWNSLWSLGMANTTYGAGNVWYLGYSLNEFRMDSASSKYPVNWRDARMDFWGHAINFALNNARKIDVAILPYKQWKGAWIIRIDTDTYYWKNSLLPPESILQSGWVYDYQYSVLGYTRTAGTADLSLTAGAPAGYVGLPSTRVMHTSVTGVLQTNFQTRTYRAIIYNSTVGGAYDRIRLNFNENMNFADDAEYQMWQNMTYPTVMGKLYWSKITPNFSQPTSINVGWWQTPMLVENENTNLPRWKQYGSDYGLSYSFHGWQHVSLNPGSSSYPMWNGTQFLLNTTYTEEKFTASRYWMKEKFEGTGHGFEEDQVVISHPFDAHPSEVDSIIDRLPWVLLQYSGQMDYVGFGRRSATSKYTLSSSRQEDFYTVSAFDAIEDMAKTLYPVISTYTHALGYNASLSFPPYSNTIKPANPRDAFTFWLNAKYMLENTRNAFYQSDRITLEFNANNALRDYVWRFPIQLNGKQFSNFFDNRSMGHIKHTDENYVYIEFSQGQGPQRLEVNYGTPVSTVTVNVSKVSPPVGGYTNPAAGTYTVAENTLFSMSATPNSGYTFDHWELDGVSAGSANPYSFNVSTSSHAISAFFAAVPTVTVTVSGVSPPNSGTTNPVTGQYELVQNSTFEISASPSSRYFFDHWELDGVNVGSANPYSFNVGTSDHTVSAFFAAIPTVTVTVSAVAPPNSGTTNPAAGIYTVAENSLFSISATPNSGYTFAQWELDGINVSSQPSYSFNVGSASHTIRAFFTRLLSVQIDSCDSLQNWYPTGSVLSVDGVDFREGSGAITVTTTSTPLWHIFARLVKRMDLSPYSALQIWVKPSDATRTLRLMVATDWNNYNVYTITGLTLNAWTLVSINLSTPTSRTGTINLSSISFIRFDYELRATSGFFKIDDIRGVPA